MKRSYISFKYFEKFSILLKFKKLYKGNTKTLHTVGAKWSYLQSHKFGANAQPFYVILDPATGKPLTGSRAYDEDIDGYLEYLNKGLNRFDQFN